MDQKSTTADAVTAKTTTKKPRRRTRGAGSVYRKVPGGTFWIAYYDLNGKRRAECAQTKSKPEAEKLLRQRAGAIDNGAPVTPQVGRLTFMEGAQAVVADYRNNNKRSIEDVERRIVKHLIPYFGRCRMAAVDTGMVRKYIAHRQERGIVNRKGERIADVSPAEINRELTILKRAFSLAQQDGRLLHRPHVPMLAERNTRTGFFEPDQIGSVLASLPNALRPVVEFAYMTGWRTASEVLPLEWRNIDFAAGEVRLDAHTTKNDEAACSR